MNSARPTGDLLCGRIDDRQAIALDRRRPFGIYEELARGQFDRHDEAAVTVHGVCGVEWSPPTEVEGGGELVRQAGRSDTHKLQLHLE